MGKTTLKIGYVMQADSVEMTKVSGPQLHVKAVVQGLVARGHSVRTLAVQQDRTVTMWSDDLTTWQPAELSISKSQWFSVTESIMRGVQSRLRLPFIRLYDSRRFAEACATSLLGCEILYERFGWLSYGALMAAKRMSIPLVYEVNGDLAEEYQQLGIKLTRLQWFVINVVTKRMFEQADQVIAVSETLRERIIKRWRIDPSKVTVVANGAHVDKFLDSHKAEEARERCPLQEAPVVMFVGGFQPWHGIDLLVEAFGRIAAAVPRAKLILVGDGPVRNEIRRFADRLQLGERVVMPGTVAHEDLPALLNTAHVVVVNPRVSRVSIAQSPLKLFEYMAAGKAIVAPVTSEAERFLTHGVNALLVPPNDPDALANALLELLERDQMRLALGQAARRQAIEKHSWDHTVFELEAILWLLVDKARSKR